jgi:predicted GTPase
MDINNNENTSPQNKQTGAKDDCKHTTEIKPDLEKLNIYMQTKLALAEQLRIIRDALTALRLDNHERKCEELVVKLAEDRFILAVLGQFKRGKSSLMNAIIGHELLPTGVLPLTNAITTLKYGPVERLIVTRNDLILPVELPVSSLPDYVTEKGNPGNWKQVRSVYVELPVPFLRRGIEFVDTPGVGSIITANTATTYSFLPECDAVLFVTSADMPMTNIELEFLKDIREYVNRIFFVVNKIDLLAYDQRDEVLDFVTKAIQSLIGRDTIKVFPISALLGLEARSSDNVILYEQSGLKALEESLANFLFEEKSSVFLAAVAKKTLRVLDDIMEQEIINEAALQTRLKIMQQEKSDSILHDPYAAVTAIKEARVKIEKLYQNIVDGQMSEKNEAKVQSTISSKNIMNSQPNTVKQILANLPADSMQINMKKDFQSRGCPVCLHMAKQASNFFAHWQYQIGYEERAQDDFAAELGFCPLHTWQLLAMASPHGASVGFTHLTEHMAQLLRGIRDSSETGTKVRLLVRDSRTCRVCGLIHQAEGEYIRQIGDLIKNKEGRKLYNHSQGLCLRHLGLLMDSDLSLENREFLLTNAVQHFEEDAEDMRNFALKDEAVRRDLQNRDETDAYRRAIIRIVGDKKVCMPWAEDGEI